ncbi:MAG: 30S ribosomal protein S17 [Planctomycetota bacterium]|nr:30S ribosomal protein S17 [Planctomycetota bacterium]
MVVEKAQKSRSTQRVKLTGVVDSISGRKTVRVVVERLTKHPLYGKYVRRRKKILVHDASEEARVGDTVEMALSRPVSKSKSWRLVRVIKTSVLGASGAPEATTEK